MEDPRTDSPFESILSAEIPRLTFNANKEGIPGVFRCVSAIVTASMGGWIICDSVFHVPCILPRGLRCSVLYSAVLRYVMMSSSLCALLCPAFLCIAVLQYRHMARHVTR